MSLISALNLNLGLISRNIVIKHVRLKTTKPPSSTDVRMLEVGKCESPRPSNSPYETGQLFLHRALGYRGILLFAWDAKVYDKDVEYAKSPLKSKLKSKTANIFSSMDFSPENRFWYQALIDERDWPYVRFQVGSLAHLGVDNSQREYIGLDYVDHDDILPYKSSDKNATIKHDMLDTFLSRSVKNKDDPFLVGTDVLRVWREENLEWLDLSSVYRETTDGIRVTVIPFYMGRNQSDDKIVYWWRYCIRLESFTPETCILREREYKVISSTGKLDTIKGKGVLSMEPVLSRIFRAFQYSSRVSLPAPSGHMWGQFKMERESGRLFEVRVPPFVLLSKLPSADSTDSKKPPLK